MNRNWHKFDILVLDKVLEELELDGEEQHARAYIDLNTVTSFYEDDDNCVVVADGASYVLSIKFSRFCSIMKKHA